MVENHEAWIDIDEDVQCCAVDEIPDDKIVEELGENEEGDGEDIECESEDQEEPVTAQEALGCVNMLRRFFMQDHDVEPPQSSLNARADFVNKISMSRRSQTSIRQFFRPRPCGSPIKEGFTQVETSIR